MNVIKLHNLIPKGGSLNLSLTETSEGQVSILAGIKYPQDKMPTDTEALQVLQIPLVLTGTPEELSGDKFYELLTEVKIDKDTLVNNLASIKEANKKALATAADKNKPKTASAPAKVAAPPTTKGPASASLFNPSPAPANSAEAILPEEEDIPPEDETGEDE